MTEIQNKLDKAYGYLSKIPVVGAGVKQMALAMQEIEDAFRAAGEAPQKEGVSRNEAPGDAV